jgi:hypothetical protein
VENLSLLGSSLAIITSLTAMVRYLLKVNWKLKREADQAKAVLIQRQLTELEALVQEHKGFILMHSTKLDIFDKKLNEFSKRLDSNRDSADAAVSSLRAFVNSTEERFKYIETNFGKVILKP